MWNNRGQWRAKPSPQRFLRLNSVLFAIDGSAVFVTHDIRLKLNISQPGMASRGVEKTPKCLMESAPRAFGSDAQLQHRRNREADAVASDGLDAAAARCFLLQQKFQSVLKASCNYKPTLFGSVLQALCLRDFVNLTYKLCRTIRYLSSGKICL